VNPPTRNWGRNSRKLGKVAEMRMAQNDRLPPPLALSLDAPRQTGNAHVSGDLVEGTKARKNPSEMSPKGCLRNALHDLCHEIQPREASILRAPFRT